MATRITILLLLFSGVANAQNLVTDPEDFTSGNWNEINNATTSADSALAPNQTTTADSLIADGATNLNQITQTGISVVSGQRYAMSIYANSDEVETLTLLSTAVTGGIACWNFTTGADVFFAAGIDGSGIIDVGDGWFRAYATFIADSTGTSTFVVRLGDGNNGDCSNEGADYSNGDDIKIWGAQMEARRIPGQYQAVDGWACTSGTGSGGSYFESAYFTSGYITDGYFGSGGGSAPCSLGLFGDGRKRPSLLRGVGL